MKTLHKFFMTETMSLIDLLTSGETAVAQRTSLITNRGEHIRCTLGATGVFQFNSIL